LAVLLFDIVKRDVLVGMKMPIDTECLKSDRSQVVAQAIVWEGAERTRLGSGLFLPGSVK